MKDTEPVVTNQFEFIEHEGVTYQKIIQKPLYICKDHKWAKETDLVDVVIKKTGETVKRCIYCERIKLEHKKERTSFWHAEKENLSDLYIKTVLRSGKNGLKQEPPEQLIDATRAVIKLNRVVKKLTDPVKECDKHGKLYRKDVIKSGKSKAGTPQYKCRACMKEMHKRHYELNKLKVKLQQKKYKESNPEKVKQTKKDHVKRNRERYRLLLRERWRKYVEKNPEAALERNRRYKKKMVSELTDTYMKKCLTRDTSLKHEDIPQSLIEVQRALMQLKRGVKHQIKQNKILELEDKKDGQD